MGRFADRDAKLHAVALVVVKGDSKTEVARRFVVSERTVHRWVEAMGGDRNALEMVLQQPNHDPTPVDPKEEEQNKTKAELEMAKYIIEESKKTIAHLEGRIVALGEMVDEAQTTITTLRWCIQQLGGKNG